MMKKLILIFIPILLLMAGVAWYLLSPGDREPLIETISGLLPFGSGEGLTGPTTDPSTALGTSNQEAFDEFGQPTVDLFRLAVEPVAGAVVFNKSSTGSTSSPQATPAVRYVDRATGHIFEIILPTGSASGVLEKKKITNRTLPKIYEAYFRPDGNAVLMRSLRADSDVVENLSLTLTPPNASSTDGLYNISAANLRGDMTSIAVGSGNILYYSLKDSGSIVSSPFNNTALRTIFTSAFSDWSLAPAGLTLFIYPKASASAVSYAYTLGASGNLNKVLGPLNGLTVVPDSSGTRVVYSYLDGTAHKSEVKNLQSGVTTSILPATLAEKCVWSVRTRGILYCAAPSELIGGNEPDNWYRGATHFSDSIWRFYTNDEIAQVLSEPKANLGLDIDVIEPKLSPNEDYLIFTNKRDLSLWALKLEQF